MQLGMVGLGRMGANMVRRLMRGGHQLAGFDPNDTVKAALNVVVSLNFTSWNRIADWSSARSSGDRSPSELSSTSLAVMIAVIGDRMSWLTERRTAVFTASLRRNASASLAVRTRSSASAARRRARAASSLTLTAVTR